jgi:hypothetical protein
MAFLLTEFSSLQVLSFLRPISCQDHVSPDWISEGNRPQTWSPKEIETISPGEQRGMEVQVPGSYTHTGNWFKKLASESWWGG